MPKPKGPKSLRIMNRMGEQIDEHERRIAELEAELARVRQAHREILNEVLYGGTDLRDEPDINRIHDCAKVGLADMIGK